MPVRPSVQLLAWKTPEREELLTKISSLVLGNWVVVCLIEVIEDNTRM